MNLQRFGTAYGGWTIFPDLVPDDGVILDCGVGTDMTFTEAVHELKPGIRAVLVDHTDEAANYVLKDRAHPWVTFVNAAIAPEGMGRVQMYRHKTRSGSESTSSGHRFADVSAPYSVPAISLSDLIRKHKPCLVKLDIESAEYGVLAECIGVPQICVEFHHRMDSRFTRADTSFEITNLEANGYVVAHRTPEDEVLFVRKELLK